MGRIAIRDRDLIFENGRFQIVSGLEAYAQRINERILLRLGEIRHEEELGIDWLTIFEKPILPERIQGEIEKAAKADPETLSVRTVSLSIDREKREFNCMLNCVSPLGAVSVSI